MDVTFRDGGEAAITVDSGAEESVCPWGWGEQFGIRQAERQMNFRNATGGIIQHYGSRDVVVASPF